MLSRTPWPPRAGSAGPGGDGGGGTANTFSENVPDAEFELAHAVFSEKELADLTIAIGLINTYNRIAISFRREPELRTGAPAT